MITDTIIVGAGSAGCVLANRLSKNRSHSVLVLEAGKHSNDINLKIPLGVSKIWNAPNYNWNYSSAEEPFLDGRKICHPRGKTLGGCSAINLMAFVRGDPRDFDRWARQYDCSGWAYNDVLRYFKQLEHWHGPPGPERGGAGPIHVNPVNTGELFFDQLEAAALQAGHPVIADFNAGSRYGFSRMQYNIDNGRRCSAATAYLEPAIRRENVQLIEEALVTDLIMAGNRVLGVRYRHEGELTEAFGSRIILSAGAYNTPQLLMLSGIGPAEHLTSQGVKVRVDLPGVGQNLRDHAAIDVAYNYHHRADYVNNLRVDRLLRNLLQAIIFRSGPAANMFVGATAFIHSDPDRHAADAIPGGAIPDIQVLFSPIARQIQPFIPGIKPLRHNSFFATVCHLQPASTGSVTLASPDPETAPVICNRFLSAQSDIITLRKAIHRVREIFNQPAMQQLCGEELAPGAGTDIDTYVRTTLATVYHPCGTCKMGHDAMAVTCPEDLSVNGCENLHVVDASIMPDLTNGNIQAPVLMIAEKIAAGMVRAS